jgi:hypothetical protein
VISATLLNHNGSNTNAASYGTNGSISPGANRLLLCATHASFTSSTGQNTPTCSGNGLNWVLVDTVTAIGAGVMQRLSVFRAMGASPTSGAVTVSYGGQTQANGIVYVVEFDGVDTSGTDGSGAIVQSAVASDDAAGTSLTVTLAGFGDAVNNATFGAFAIGDNGITLNAGSGFTAFTQNTAVTESAGARCEWRTGEDTSVDMTWTSIGGRRGIAIEIKAAGGGGGGDRVLTVQEKVRGRMRGFLPLYAGVSALALRSVVNVMLDIGTTPIVGGSSLLLFRNPLNTE